MDKLIITIVGVLGIGFTYWFFLMRKAKSVVVKEEVKITVDGGYTPEVISVPVGKETKIHFFRKDPSDCLDEVVLPEFKIRKKLALNKTTTIIIKPEKVGEYEFSCGMNMFHGKIIAQ